MKHISAFNLILGVAAVLLLAACGGTPEADIEYVPFQEAKDGSWGMMAPDGKVLFDGQFKQQPMPATCGRFWVPNDQGYYELYKADKKPRRVNETEYRHVSQFYDGRAFVAERDCPVTVIDTSGKTLVTLDTIDGREPDCLGDFYEGTASVRIDTLQGVVNDRGKLIVPVEYTIVGPMSSGKVVACKGYPFFFYGHEEMGFGLDELVDISDSVAAKPVGTADIYDSKGNILFTVSNKDYAVVGQKFLGDYLPVAREVDGEMHWGLLDAKGETALAPQPKVRQIAAMRDGLFIFVNEVGHYGLMSLQGETLVRPQYKGLAFACDNMLIATEEAPDTDRGMACKLIGTDGANVTKAYTNIYPFLPSAMKYAFVKVGPGNYGIIDRKGERVTGVPDIYSVVLPWDTDFDGPSEQWDMPSGWMQSDYIDVQAFVDKLDITADGLDGLTFSSSPQQALEVQASTFSFNNKPSASDYTATSTVFIYRTVGGESVSENVKFPQTLSTRTYSSRQVIDYVDYYYGWYWYHIEKVPKGYVFRSMTPSTFEISMSNYGKFRGKLRLLYRALSAKFKGWGDVEAENNNAVLVKLSNGKQAIVYLDSNNVTARWGSLGKKVSVDEYANSREILSADPLAADSAAVY